MTQGIHMRAPGGAHEMVLASDSRRLRELAARGWLTQEAWEEARASREEVFVEEPPEADFTEYLDP